MTLSCLLGQSGVRAACVDQVPPDVSRTEDLRTTAISYGSRGILAQTGVWSLLEDTACPINDIQILDGNSSVLLNFLSTEVADKSFGWIVENADLRAALRHVMQGLDSVHHMAPVTVRDFEVSSDQASVMTDQGTIEAPLIVGADGRRSFMRAWMGVRTRQWRYNQQAIICTVSHAQPHNNIAVEHFWPEGPFAILPMTDSVDSDDAQNKTYRSSVVFTEHGSAPRSLMQYSDHDFEILLAGRFPERYGAVKVIGRRACYPLGLVHAAEYIAPRMALVADAAHGIHPIAGQGLNLGFRDVETLAELVIQARKAQTDIGSPALLQIYQRRRRPDNTAMAAVTDGLNRLFSNNLRSVRFLRRIGLRAVSKIPPAKAFFMKQAMGDRS